MSWFFAEELRSLVDSFFYVSGLIRTRKRIGLDDQMTFFLVFLAVNVESFWKLSELTGLNCLTLNGSSVFLF